MGFVADTDAIEIGVGVGGSHIYHWTQYRNRLYVIFLNRKRQAVIHESRDQGLKWQEVANLGKADACAIRGPFATTKRGNRLSIFDTPSGNVILNSVVGLPNARGDIVEVPWGGVPIPVPESNSGLCVLIQFQERFGSQYAFYLPGQFESFGRVPGRRMFAFWGSEEVGSGFNNLQCIWNYVDPFWEAISFAAWATYRRGTQGMGSWVTERRLTKFGFDYGPFPHTFENDIHGSGYEGFVNARRGWEGVGKQEGNPAPSFFMPADHWQGNLNNSAPMWVPNLTSRYYNYKSPISSTPNGLSADAGFSRGAVMGYVQGRRTFGMIEPGYGFAHCAGDGIRAVPNHKPNVFVGSGDSVDPYGQRYEASFSRRKFLGNLGVPFVRSSMWMPHSNGIFGMGVMASLATNAPGEQTVMWIYDKHPERIPTSVLVDDEGRYTERDEKNASKAVRGDSKYYRW